MVPSGFNKVLDLLFPSSDISTSVLMRAQNTSVEEKKKDKVRVELQEEKTVGSTKGKLAICLLMNWVP